MATLSTTAMTLSDWAKRLDPDGNTADVVELLAETNEILDDILWVEGNLPTGHRTTVRTGLPDVTWRKLNYGVQPSKSTTRQVDDTCGMLEARSEPDKDLIELNGNTAQARLTEDKAFLEAMNQEFANKLIYGDASTDPEQIMGLDPRYPYSDAPNVINAGGTGTDVTSLWLVVWGPNTVHGIFPKGSMAGLKSEDLGRETVEDAAGGKYNALVTWYQWKCGITVRDWRYVVRIANIEASIAGSSNNFLDTSNPTLRKLIAALNTIPNMRMGRPVIYANRHIKTQMDIAAYDKYGGFNYADIFGREVTTFRGIPIRMIDQIGNETALTPTP